MTDTERGYLRHPIIRAVIDAYGTLDCSGAERVGPPQIVGIVADYCTDREDDPGYAALARALLLLRDGECWVARHHRSLSRWVIHPAPGPWPLLPQRGLRRTLRYWLLAALRTAVPRQRA